LSDGELSFSRVLRGSIWLTASTVLANLFGFIYWLIVSPLVPPATVGRAAATLAVESLLLATLSLGIPTGIMRFLGGSYGGGDARGLGLHFYSNLLFILGLDFVAGGCLVILGLAGISINPLDTESLLFASVLILLGSNGWALLLTAFFNSILKTEYVTIAGFIAGITRILVGAPLVYYGQGFFGLMVGYVASAATSSLALLILAIRELRRLAASFILSSLAVREAVRAGLAAWTPSILTLAGQWVGVLGLGGFTGGHEAGNYFIAYAITAGLLAFPLGILQLTFPVVSGMEDGRKRMMGRSVKMASAAMYPIAFTLIAYPYTIPTLLGRPYLPSAGSIRILAAGFLMAPLVDGYTYYAYALGNYKQVTLIGLAGNLPRIILYLLLIGQFAGEGAAASFSLGFLFSLIAAAPLARRAGYHLNLSENSKILATPFILYILVNLLQLPPITGIPLLLTASYITYTRLRIVSEKDLQDLFIALLSKKTLDALSPYLRPILKILYG